MEQELKIAVIGNSDSILLYKSVGCHPFPVTKSSEAEEILIKVLADSREQDEYAIIFVEERYFKNLSEDLRLKMSKKPLPAVIPIPSASDGNSDYALKRLSEITERAIGSDILN
jgi:vacuolar-type H+-ATPase subunit F/Vma7